jgi:hypothetical protein
MIVEEGIRRGSVQESEEIRRALRNMREAIGAAGFEVR